MGKQGSTECFLFQDIFQRPVHAVFDQERGTSDGGAVLLAAADKRLQLTSNIAAVLTERRNGPMVFHHNEPLLKQRIYGIACGYHDGNDAGRMRNDPLFKIIAGAGHEMQELASQPTISRFENEPQVRHLYHVGQAIVDSVIGHHAQRLGGRAKRIVIDLDPTVDPTHGEQQLTFFNGFYDTHCYLPLLGFIQFNSEPDQYVFTALLRPGNAPDKKGAAGVLKRVIPKLMAAFPGAEIQVRLDGGFANEEILALLETWKGLKYAVNMPKNSILVNRAAKWMKKARRKSKATGRAARTYGEFRYAARTWAGKRRIIAKAEVVVCPDREPRDNARFLVTNMAGSPREVYEHFYCMRGDTENRIKELKQSLALDRTSCTKFAANQLRVFLSAAAFALVQEIRRCASGTSYARAQAPRIVDHLIKLGARIHVSVRRIMIQMPVSAPARVEWGILAAALGAAPA